MVRHMKLLLTMGHSSAKIRLLLALLSSQFLPVAKSSGTTFQRIDSNPFKRDSSASTKMFHVCSLDPTCNYVVKPTENADLEKRPTVDDVTKFYNVWRKIHFATYADCKQAKQSGEEKDGVVAITLPNAQIINAFCVMEEHGGGWTVFQRRVDDSVNFNRNWTEYKNGFGEVFGNVWLGLENIHQLIKGGNVTLRIDLKRSDGEVGHALYTNFSITDEADAYRLNYGSYSGTVGSDSLEFSKGCRFSTADRDNDKSIGNCAIRWIGGWWYSSCFEANLNNEYFQGLEQNPRDGDGIMPTRMSWLSWRRYYGDITFSEMKLRREK